MGFSEKWNAKLYDSKHNFVSKYGSDVIRLLEPKKDELILDLGCGTGDLSKEISEFGARVTGIDASEDMINQAKEKYPSLNFHVMDATKIELENKYDAVFSNAALHWIVKPGKVLDEVNKVLRKGGRFVVEFGGKGNCQAITSCLIDIMNEEGYPFDMKDFPWYFPSIGEYSSLLEEKGFEVEYAIHFKRPTKLEGNHGLFIWLTMFAGKFYKGIPIEKREEISRKAEERLRSKLFINDEWVADYKRIRIVARKIC